MNMRLPSGNGTDIACFDHVSDIEQEGREQEGIEMARLEKLNESNELKLESKSSNNGSDKTLIPSPDDMVNKKKGNLDNEKVKVGNVEQKIDKDDNDNVPKKVSINHRNIAIFCLILSLAGFPLGWDVATSNSVLSNGYFPVEFLSSWTFGVVISTFHIGCCFGSLVLGNKLANLKILLQLAISIYGFGAIVQILGIYFCNQTTICPFIIGRFIIGIGCGTLGVVGPCYMQELIVGGNKTGFYLSFYQIMVASTIFIGNLINYYFNSWVNYIYLVEIIKVVYVVIFHCLIWWLPNSIKYFKILKQYNQLWIIYNKLIINLNDVVFQQIINTPLNNFDIKFSKSQIKPLIIACLIMIFQQFTGINYFFYYGTIIFKSREALLILGSINLFSSFFSCWLIQKVRLKLILAISSYLMSIILIIYANLGQFTDYSAILIVLTTLFIILFAISWGPGAGILVNLTSYGNPHIMAGAIASNWFANCIITMITPWMISNAGFLYGYLFAIMLLISGTFIHYFIDY